jgi:SPP1 family predicted phage head-tail adaptor
MMQGNGANDRNHRIKIFKPVTAPDGYGGLTTEYELAYERWVQIMPPTYREQEAQGAPMSRETLTIKIQPTHKDLKRGWRLEWQSEIYTVISVDNSYRERTLFVAQRYNPGE